MIDLNNIMRYHENNRIEAKKAAGGFPTSLSLPLPRLALDALMEQELIVEAPKGYRLRA